MLILWGRGLLPIFNLNEQNFQTQKGRVKNDFSFFTRSFFGGSAGRAAAANAIHR